MNAQEIGTAQVREQEHVWLERLHLMARELRRLNMPAEILPAARTCAVVGDSIQFMNALAEVGWTIESLDASRRSRIILCTCVLEEFPGLSILLLRRKG